MESYRKMMIIRKLSIMVEKAILKNLGWFFYFERNIFRGTADILYRQSRDSVDKEVPPCYSTSNQT